jgi:hypothetical protein
MGQTVNISTSDVPPSYCPSSIQVDWPFLVALLSAELAGANFTFNYGPDTPAPDDQDKPWFKTDANFLSERWYTFSSGAWVSLHPEAPGSVKMYEGLEATIETYDGGEAGTVTATTGPMWEKVTALNGRFPLGPGTLASGTVVAVTNTGGEEKHELTEEELPNITIQTKQRSDLQDGGGSIAHFTHATFPGDTVDVDEFGGDADGETVAHNNMPPYYGIFFIRRTARTHYRI